MGAELTPFSTARAIRDGIRDGALTARAACEATLARIRVVDPVLHAFQQVDAERALARADAPPFRDDENAKLPPAKLRI